GVLPPVEYVFRDALRGQTKGKDGFETLLLRTAEEFIAKKQCPAAVALAWQCWQLDERPLADNLLALALADCKDEGERLATTLTAIEYLWQPGQFPRADALVQGLLADEKLARAPGLWRLASQLAQRRDMADRSAACLERALDIEYQDLPEVIDLESWRRDYRT